MGLTELLARAATSRAHVLIAEAPGAFRQRVALERAMDMAGWRMAESVADADVLAVVGDPGPDLRAVIEHAWGQMSEPRARIHVHDKTDLASALGEAREELVDAEKQRALAAADPKEHDEHGQHKQHDDGQHGDGQHGEHEQHDSDEDQSEHDQGGHDHGGHDHGGMAPDGIPLAEGAEDRDGLEMDELHLPLGPVLAHWPAGLIVRLTLHGDVVSAAEIEQLGANAAPTREDGPAQAARLLDAAASVLVLVGLPTEAARIRRLRDRCVDGSPLDAATIVSQERRIRRHRLLRWLLGGLAVAHDDGSSEALHQRLVALVERAREAIDVGAAPAALDGPTIDAVPDLLRGQELAAVRLWMAVLSPDLTNAARGEAAHG